MWNAQQQNVFLQLHRWYNLRMGQILKQTTWLLLAQGITRIIGFFYLIFLAKNLGVYDFGLFTVALAYFSIVSSMADFGFNRFLIREAARDKLKIAQLVWNVLMLRLTLTSVVFALFALGLYILDPIKVRVNLILLAVLAILPQCMALTFDGIFVALQNFKFSALALFISSISTVLLGVYLVGKGLGPTGAVTALIFGQLMLALTLFIFLQIRGVLSLSNISGGLLKKALLGSLPYGMLGILGLLYFRIDAIILIYLRGSYETGLYGVSYRFLEAIIFIPGAFGAVLFPNLASLHQRNLAQMKKLYFKSLKLMAILGLALLLGYIFILPPIFMLFLPQFLPATQAIKILALSIPFIFMATPGVQVLLSTEKYLKKIIFFSFFTVAFNIILNLIFIPGFGFLAAAWITVASDVLSFVLFYSFISRKIFANDKN